MTSQSTKGEVHRQPKAQEKNSAKIECSELRHGMCGQRLGWEWVTQRSKDYLLVVVEPSHSLKDTDVGGSAPSRCISGSILLPSALNKMSKFLGLAVMLPVTAIKQNKLGKILPVLIIFQIFLVGVSGHITSKEEQYLLYCLLYLERILQ